MLVTALAFVGLMVFEWGMDLSGRSSAEFSGGEIGRVNGEAVTYNEYLNATAHSTSSSSRSSEGRSPRLRTGRSSRRPGTRSSWSSCSSRRSSGEGSTATDAEVRQAALSCRRRSSTGTRCSRRTASSTSGKYQQFLASPAVDDQLLLQLEAYYRDIIAAQQALPTGRHGLVRLRWRAVADLAGPQGDGAGPIHRARPRAPDPGRKRHRHGPEVEAFYRANAVTSSGPAGSVRLVVLDEASRPRRTPPPRSRALAAARGDPGWRGLRRGRPAGIGGPGLRGAGRRSRHLRPAARWSRPSSRRSGRCALEPASASRS